MAVSGLAYGVVTKSYIFNQPLEWSWSLYVAYVGTSCLLIAFLFSMVTLCAIKSRHHTSNSFYDSDVHSNAGTVISAPNNLETAPPYNPSHVTNIPSYPQFHQQTSEQYNHQSFPMTNQHPNQHFPPY